MPEPPKITSGVSLRGVSRIVALTIGILGMLGSLILAAGALVAAIGIDFSGEIAGSLSHVCDILAGPLKSAFSFTGDNAQQKQNLVVWGVAALGYLIIGSFAQSLERRR